MKARTLDDVEKHVEKILRESGVKQQQVISTEIGLCLLCEDQRVFRVVYKVEGAKWNDELKEGCPAVGGRICIWCYHKIKSPLRDADVRPKENPKLAADYKRFLKGKAHPQIQVTHTAHDGSVAKARLKSTTKFFS